MPTYHVNLDKSVIGQVVCEKEGLYYYIRCRCKILDERIYKLLAVSENQRITLGTLVPEHGELVLDTRIPIKRLPGEDHTFLAVCQPTQGVKPYIMLRNDAPLPTLELLKGGRFGYHGMDPVIYLHALDQSASDTPE